MVRVWSSGSLQSVTGKERKAACHRGGRHLLDKAKLASLGASAGSHLSP